MLGNEAGEKQIDGGIAGAFVRDGLALEPGENIGSDKGLRVGLAIDVIDSRRDLSGAKKIALGFLAMTLFEGMKLCKCKVPKPLIAQPEFDYCKAPEVEPGRWAKGLSSTPLAVSSAGFSDLPLLVTLIQCS